MQRIRTHFQTHAEAMQHLPADLRTQLPNLVKRCRSGFVIDQQALSEVWTISSSLGNVPGWRRFSRFCQTTAVQFIHLQTPDARPAGEPTVWYHVTVIVILVFDLLGVTIPPDELVSFFEETLGPSSDNDEHPSSELDGGCSSLDPTPSLTMSSSDATGFGDSQPERLRVESQGMNRRKKMRLEQVLKEDGIDTQSPDHELDVDSLVSLIRKRDRTIENLRSQKT